MRRQNHGRVARMHPGLFNMFHNSANAEGFAIADHIHIHLDGILNKLIHQHRPLRRGPDRALNIIFQGLIVIDNLHGPAAKNIRRPDQNRIADFSGNAPGLGKGNRVTVSRLNQA